VNGSAVHFVLHCRCLRSALVEDTYTFSHFIHRLQFYILTPNANHSGLTAPLTSKVAFYMFIQQIYVLNILNIVYTLSLFLFKMQFVS